MARPRNKVWILLFMSMWLGMAIAHEAFGADLQRAEREYTKFIEHIEKHAEYLKKEINYWEYQLAGARKIFYPEHFGIRDMDRRWISDYKHQLGKIEKDIIYLKEKRPGQKRVVSAFDQYCSCSLLPRQEAIGIRRSRQPPR